MSAIAQTGSGVPWAKFANLGDSAAGRIVSFQDLQDTEFETDVKKGVTKGDLKYFPSGDPIMFTRVVLEASPGDEDSRIQLDVKTKLMMRAVANAIREAGRSDLQVGDDLAVAWTGMDGRAKAYKANYVANESDAPATSFATDEEPPF